MGMQLFRKDKRYKAVEAKVKLKFVTENRKTTIQFRRR